MMPARSESGSAASRITLGAVLLCLASLPLARLAAGPLPLTARAGADRRVGPGPVMLDARASSHPAGAPLGYQWSFTGGPAPAKLSSDTTATPSVELTTPGTYTFGLRVFDPYRMSQLTEVAISVDDLPPSCGAGNDRLVPTGPVALEGWATDPNRQTLGVTWVQIKGPKPAALADPRALVTSFVAAPDATGIYEFVLKVTDGAHTTSSAPLRIEVDDPPTAEAYGNPAALAPGQKTELNGAGSADKNPEDLPLVYAWSVTGPEKGELTGTDQQYARFTGRLPGEYAIKLEVKSRTNARSASATATVKVKNVYPVAQIAAPPAGHREEVELDGSGSTDENGEPLTYEWKHLEGPEPLEISDSTSPRPKVTARRPGSYKIQLVVKDAESESSPATAIVTFKNTAPVPRVLPLITCPPGRVVLDAAGSVDADGDAVRCVWRQLDGPVRVRLEDPGSVRPRATFIVPGTYGFELQVNDGVSYSFPVRVTVNVVK